jgi:integrase
MAAIQCRNGSYRVLFRYSGKQHAFTLGEVSQEEAETKASQVDYLLLRLKQRLAVLPPGVEIVEYVQYDGKVIPPESPAAEKITLATLRDRYIETHQASLEPNTLKLIQIHFGHLQKILGEDFCVSDTQLSDLQRYVDKRTKAKGLHGRQLSATTIGKEIATLCGAWTWGTKMKLLSGPFPNDGLRYPKTVEKLPFMTRAEIERRIKAGGLIPAEVADLWDAYYLTIEEVTDFLTHVKTKAIQPWVYPMSCFAAHTGARRSEMLRVKVTDVDFASQTVLIQEKKKVKGKTTTRRVPLSAFLISVLQDWLKIHPGGPFLFCAATTVPRSRKRSTTTGHKGAKTRPKTAAARLMSIQERPLQPVGAMTPDECHDHFKRTMATSKWKNMRGWHVLRHSFISACASKGVDQRLVEEWAGHMSAEMSRRYRHLYPSTQQAALATVFG